MSTNVGNPGESDSTPVPETNQSLRKLPDIKDLYADVDMSSKQNALNILLNQPPKENWIKEHPMIKIKVKDHNGQEMSVPLRYLPIARVEWLLTTVFLEWETEVKMVQQLANAICVTVRLKVKSPITGEWIVHEGVGAMDIQTKKGASAADFSQIVSGAIPKGLPAAKSYAIKDAAENLGRLFGKDLGRADQIGYDHLLSKLDNEELLNK